MLAASLRAAAGAVTFLTRVPLGRVVTVDEQDVARSAVLFPLVGAAVGALTGGVAVLLHPAVPTLLAAALAVAAAVVLTGALHLDALADTLDATGAASREEALEIMRDPRLGTFGAAAIALDVAVKVAAVAVLLDAGDAIAGLVAAGALSRAASPPLAAVLPYPRARGGPGSVLGRVRPGAAVAAAALGVAAAVLAAGSTGAIAVGVAAAVVVGLAVVYARWLGGATGDALGAATELTEVAVLVLAAALA